MYDLRRKGTVTSLLYIIPIGYWWWLYPLITQYTVCDFNIVILINILVGNCNYMAVYDPILANGLCIYGLSH